MKFEVPTKKDQLFASDLLTFLSSNLTELKNETGKWPDRIFFAGQLGAELFSYLQEMQWDLKTFGPTLSASPSNSMVFEYSKPIDQIEDRGAIPLGETLNQRTISGIPSAETVAKITSTYAAPAFRIERQVRPSITIKLIRKK